MAQFVLVDCNNFFVSCERLFRPNLEKKPVIVLSSNDGCVVSRSKEAKAIGIPMGVPFFQISKLCSMHNVIVCSSNFELYGDISSRVMRILREYAPHMEAYSIDEAFLQYDDPFGLKELFSICLEIRRKILQFVGIPTSIGIGPTKTLAKIATDLAKKEPVLGVTDLCRPIFRQQVLAQCGVEEIWGVGTALARRLHRLGITTALDLANQDPLKIRAHFGVVGERIVFELRGQSCLPLNKHHTRKSLTCSRSFGEKLNSGTQISYALCTHVSSGASCLRKEGLCAGALEVFIEDVDWQIRSSIKQLLFPTNDSAQLITEARKTLTTNVYKEGLWYRRCGVVFSGLVEQDEIPSDLFANNRKRKETSTIVDQVQQRFGRRSLFYAATGTSSSWKASSSYKSDQYTGDWNGLAVVKA